jgi:hypothetical protein
MHAEDALPVQVTSVTDPNANNNAAADSDTLVVSTPTPNKRTAPPRRLRARIDECQDEHDGWYAARRHSVSRVRLEHTFSYSHRRLRLKS